MAPPTDHNSSPLSPNHHNNFLTSPHIPFIHSDHNNVSDQSDAGGEFETVLESHLEDESKDNSIMGTPKMDHQIRFNISEQDSSVLPIDSSPVQKSNGKGTNLGRKVSSKIKMLRMATRRHPNGRVSRSKSTKDRLSSVFHPKHHPEVEPPPNDQDDQDQDQQQQQHRPRRIYVNMPLPKDALNENGLPIVQYKRNKTRTARYTPLTFIPKNLFYQFQTVANVYFVSVVILGCFSIFGQSNPGLSAVPIIVIVLVTGVKDAIEDYRRTLLDHELNNTPTLVLTDWYNPNVADENISLWRKLKKKTSAFIIATFKSFKLKRKLKKQRVIDFNNNNQTRHHDDDDIERRRRESENNIHNSIELSRTVTLQTLDSNQGQRRLSNDSDGAPAYRGPSIDEHLMDGGDDGDLLSAPATKYSTNGFFEHSMNGDLVDHYKQTPGKAHFKKNYWKNVRVGDIVRIRNDMEIPADIVVLSTSDADGACYIETRNLDGESNLKIRHALRSGQRIRHSKQCEQATFYIDSEPPAANLYSYSGVARWNQRDPKNPEAPPEPMSEAISINNMLLRGCTLRNTQWIIGIAIFTGDDSKIMMNSGASPAKRSRVSKSLVSEIVYNFILLFILCFVSGLVNGLYWRDTSTSAAYFEFGYIGNTPAAAGIVTFFTGVILFQSLVPISLYISVEIIKTIQAYFIWADCYLYYAPIDYPCTPKSWNISDDLGQIEYVFSDKTGTLTQNVMEFKKCTVNGVAYGLAYTEAMAGLQRRKGIDVDEEGTRMRAFIEKDKKKMLKLILNSYNNPQLVDDQLTFISSDFVEDLNGRNGSEQADENSKFMMALALCHSVVTEESIKYPGRLEFKAQSPDEAALVSTARDLGFALLERTQRGVIIDVHGIRKEFQVLTILEFNSTRKRMSVIVRNPDNGQITLICKGADSVIYSRLKRGQQPEMREITSQHLEEFATEGLRTLCIAERDISPTLYKEWAKSHEIAASAVENRDEKLEVVADSIERELTLLGGTAIEDRLQDGVPHTIALLSEAGIKLWVLTGDKVETAINIGFSCNLLDNSMELIVFQSNDSISLELEVLKYLNEYFGLRGTEDEFLQAKMDHSPPPATHGLIIDGDTLKIALESQKIKYNFLLLCKQCKSVMCCRVSPSQKAQVVNLVKTGFDVMTLSIGDGANDVAMIQQADVGIGIAGEEGRQAVMSSDYAIGQFRFLARLLLVHGRWSYRRLGEMIANFFYKNVVFTITLFWYQIFCNFDGTYLFDYTYILLFNLAFTSLPVIVLGVLDQDVSDRVSMAVPQLYRRGILRLEWTELKFWAYMIDGCYQSVIAFFFGYLVFYSANVVTSNGLKIDESYLIGIFVATTDIIVVNTYVILNQYRWDWFSMFIYSLSILLLFFWTGVYSTSPYSAQLYRSAPEVYGTLTYWCYLLVSVITCLLPSFTFKCIERLWFPKPVDIVREQVKMGYFDHLDGPAPEEGMEQDRKIAEIKGNDFEEPDDHHKRVSSKASRNGSRKSHKSHRSILSGDIESQSGSSPFRFSSGSNHKGKIGRLFGYRDDGDDELEEPIVSPHDQQQEENDDGFEIDGGSIRDNSLTDIPSVLGQHQTSPPPQQQSSSSHSRVVSSSSVVQPPPPLSVEVSNSPFGDDNVFHETILGSPEWTNVDIDHNNNNIKNDNDSKLMNPFF